MPLDPYVAALDANVRGLRATAGNVTGSAKPPTNIPVMDDLGFCAIMTRDLCSSILSSLSSEGL